MSSLDQEEQLGRNHNQHPISIGLTIKYYTPFNKTHLKDRKACDCIKHRLIDVQS